MHALAMSAQLLQMVTSKFPDFWRLRGLSVANRMLYFVGKQGESGGTPSQSVLLRVLGIDIK